MLHNHLYSLLIGFFLLYNALFSRAHDNNFNVTLIFFIKFVFPGCSDVEQLRFCCEGFSSGDDGLGVEVRVLNGVAFSVFNRETRLGTALDRLLSLVRFDRAPAIKVFEGRGIHFC